MTKDEIIDAITSSEFDLVEMNAIKDALDDEIFIRENEDGS